MDEIEREESSAAVLSAEFEEDENYHEDGEGLILEPRQQLESLRPPPPLQAATRQQKKMAGEASTFTRCQDPACDECNSPTCLGLRDSTSPSLLSTVNVCKYCDPALDLPFLCTLHTSGSMSRLVTRRTAKVPGSKSSLVHSITSSSSLPAISPNSLLQCCCTITIYSLASPCFHSSTFKQR